MAGIAEKKNLKRNNILDAAYNLFITKSVNNTAIDEVVKKAGVAKGTFYLYFQDKYDLLDEIILRKSGGIIIDVISETQKKFKNQPDASLPEIAWYFTSCVIDILEKNRELTLLINRDFTSCLRSIANSTNPALSEAVHDMLLFFSEKGCSDPEESKKKLYLLIEMIGSVCCHAIIHENPYSIEEIKPFLKNIITKIL